MSKREELVNHYPGTEEDLLFLDPEYFDEAIIGVAQRADGLFVVCYSEPKIIDVLVRHEQMDPEMALEHYSFNVLGSFMGECTPVFVDDTLFAK